MHSLEHGSLNTEHQQLLQLIEAPNLHLNFLNHWSKLLVTEEYAEQFIISSLTTSERWYRSLKTAIKRHNTRDWCEVLPVVLLGLRTSFKEDIQASAPEMIFGTTLRLPEKYFTEEETPIKPQIFLDRLRQYMQEVKSKSTAHH